LSSLQIGTSPQFYSPTNIRESGNLSVSEPRWYAVFTMSRHEKRLAAQCAERHIESFLPFYQVTRQWKNRCTVTVDLPLFPNYFFARIDLRDRLKILKLPGVFSIVSSGSQLLPVADAYILSLRAGLLAHRIEPHPSVEVGDRVRINTGPMAGMEGVLIRHKNELRVILTLEMIGRSVAVEVGSSEISFVGAPTMLSANPAWHEPSRLIRTSW